MLGQDGPATMHPLVLLAGSRVFRQSLEAIPEPQGRHWPCVLEGEFRDILACEIAAPACGGLAMTVLG